MSLMSNMEGLNASHWLHLPYSEIYPNTNHLLGSFYLGTIQMLPDSFLPFSPFRLTIPISISRETQRGQTAPSTTPPSPQFPWRQTTVGQCTIAERNFLVHHDSRGLTYGVGVTLAGTRFWLSLRLSQPLLRFSYSCSLRRSLG